MPLLGGFRVGHWFGFEIRIDWSWFLVFFLVLWTLSAQVFPRQLGGYGVTAYYAMGFVGSVLLFLSVLAHELSHSIVARSRGIEVEGITLFIFGGVARMRMEAQRAIDEFLFTAAGPLSSLALSGLFWAGAVASGTLGWPEPVRVVSEYLALINLVLAVFNMVPGFPLDGGRIFRSVVWQITGDLDRATRWATTAGRLFGYLLLGLGLWLFWWGDLVSGAWAVFLGWFLSSAAAASYRQFRLRRVVSGVPVSRVMRSEPPAIGAESTVQQAVDAFFLRHRQDVFPVVRNGVLVGVLSLDDVSEVEPRLRPTTLVRDVMEQVDELVTAQRDEDLESVLLRVISGSGGRVMVMDGDRLAGMLTMDEIGRWAERMQKLNGE